MAANLPVCELGLSVTAPGVVTSGMHVKRSVHATEAGGVVLALKPTRLGLMMTMGGWLRGQALMSGWGRGLGLVMRFALWGGVVPTGASFQPARAARDRSASPRLH